MPGNNNYGTGNPKYVVENGTPALGIPGKIFKHDDGFKGHPRNGGNSFQSIHPMHPGAYFTEFTARKALIYVLATLYVSGCALVSVAEMFLSLPCPEDANETPIKYPNPDYDPSRCAHIRQPMLLGLTPLECSFGRRLVMSILMGGVIGWERRQADRPAGIRTMSLVSLGSCLFTINSAFAFRDGPQEWDASRIAAAIPSGVGFLGAGLIFKKTNEDDMVVHGLTTAASVWLSAAVGIACGGELYFAATFGTCLMMLLLRFGPRGSDVEDDDDDETEQETVDEDVEQEANVDAVEDELVSEGLELPTGGADSSATMIFRNSDGSQNLPLGLQLPKPAISLGDTSTRGEYTVTGESIEESTTETTPMLQNQPQQQSLLQLLSQQATTPKLGSSTRSQPQSSKQRQKSATKTDKIRKRKSKPNLGTIL